LRAGSWWKLASGLVFYELDPNRATCSFSHLLCNRHCHVFLVAISNSATLMVEDYGTNPHVGLHYRNPNHFSSYWRLIVKGAIYVSDSGNTKIMGSKKVDASYASIKATCPSTCSLKDKGCYAQTSFVGMINHRMNRRARGGSPLQLARAEARAIDQSYNGGEVPAGRAFRLHVAGDSRTVKGTRVLNAAVSRWKKRGGGDAWSYTHAWQKVPRKEWGNVSILASVDGVEQVPYARAQGYAPAIVVGEHTSERAYTLPGSDVKWIPCPNQTRDVGCTDCRLCFNADRLYQNNMGIAFAAHGVKKETIKRHLKVVQ
jgi:hypothetical protein